MPVVLTVNGIIETYPLKGTAARPSTTHVEAVTSNVSEREQQRPAPDHSLVAAKQAYREQTQAVTRAKPALLAQDLMSRPVTWVPSDTTLAEAWTLMKRKGIHHLPVTSLHGTLVGMISDRDLLRYWQDLESTAGQGPTAPRTVAQLMGTRVLSATPTTEIPEIARVMLDEQVSAIPILDGGRRPMGILTTGDLLRAIVHRGALELWT